MKYWAVGLNFNYDIVSEEPAPEDWGSLDGPFDTLLEAKKCARAWIANDRVSLGYELDNINAIKAKDLKGN